MIDMSLDDSFGDLPLEAKIDMALAGKIVEAEDHKKFHKKSRPRQKWRAAIQPRKPTFERPAWEPHPSQREIPEPEPEPDTGPAHETSNHSLRFRFDSTLQAMAEVEFASLGGRDEAAASRWLAQQREYAPGTATYARRKILDTLKLTPSKALDWDEGGRRITTIRGVNGNEWTAYLNGMVILKRNTTPGDNIARKAEQLGFDVE